MKYLFHVAVALHVNKVFVYTFFSVFVGTDLINHHLFAFRIDTCEIVYALVHRSSITVSMTGMYLPNYWW